MALEAKALTTPIQAPSRLGLDQATDKIYRIYEWCEEHGFDVDATAFEEACYLAAYLAAAARGLRVPAALIPGVPTLEFACAMVGQLTLPEAMIQSQLPGSRELRRTLE